MVTVFRDDAPPAAKPPTSGDQVYQLYCTACHGPDRKGVGVAPPLLGLRHRMKEDEVRELWRTGRNLMPPQPQLTPEQQQQLLDFLFVHDRPLPPADPQ